MRSSWSSSKSAALALALFSLAGACGGDPSGADDAHFDVSGVWDAEFTGTVQGRGTTQTDSFVMELSQSDANVSGSLRTGDLALALSGTVEGASFDYEARGSLGPGCEAVVQARVTVDVDADAGAAGGEFAGPQTQSTCEGTAVGSVRARRR